MIINCALSTSLEFIMHYAKQFTNLPPLPAYITKNGPYIKNEKGGKHQIMICYEFDQSKFVEAMENICKQLISFRDLPEFALFADLFTSHSCYLIFEKAGEA
jgi:hypothetical protein